MHPTLRSAPWLKTGAGGFDLSRYGVFLAKPVADIGFQKNALLFYIGDVPTGTKRRMSVATTISDVGVGIGSKAFTIYIPVLVLHRELVSRVCHECKGGSIASVGSA